MPRTKIILGSSSPRRKDLLRKMGYKIEVRTAPCQEDFSPEMDPRKVPEFLAEKKARAIGPLVSKDELLITADTIVLLDGEIIGKPKDKEDAVRILSLLSGKMHEVITGVVLSYKGRVFKTSAVTKVYFRPLSQETIRYYVDAYSPLDKAGAYGIQEWIGLIAVEKVEGSFYNVMGLPTSLLRHEIEKCLSGVSK